MGIENPQSYGEYYWAAQLESAKLMDEQTEFALAPYFAGLLADIPGLAEAPPGLRKLLQALAEPPSAGMGGFAALTAGEFAAEGIRDLIKPGMSALARAINRGALETWLDPNQAVSLFQRQKIDDTYFDLLMTSAGYDTSIARQMSTSLLPYPAIAEIMRYARYHGDPTNTRETVWEKFDVPVDDYDMYEWLTLSVLSTDQIHRLFRRQTITDNDANLALQRVGWRDNDIDFVKELGWLLPNPMLMVQGELQQEKSRDQIIESISRSDIHPDFAETYLDAILTKPATIDLIANELRQDPELSDIERKLIKLGIHPDYVSVYKTLAYPIPPVADLVTMAVREAFTPSIAERFGQYEDFPEDFERYAMQKGVSSEWAKRYWAAHWALPSATQGFSMLHRGIIDESELNMLLRALDVMPYWRDKLVKVAYRPLTRVDVRRMYKEGVLDESQVYSAYLDHGYNDANAKAMTDFTVQYVLTQQTKFTTRDVISAYSKRMINASVARSLLQTLGVRSANISFVISTADYKREWEFTEERIKGIRNLYRRKVYDDNKARGELLKLNIATEQVDVLMQQWWYEVKDEPTQTFTTAQTLKFMTMGLITEQRGRQELAELGYDKFHIDIYMESLTWTPPKE